MKKKVVMKLEVEIEDRLDEELGYEVREIGVKLDGKKVEMERGEERGERGYWEIYSDDDKGILLNLVWDEY
jgi:hypothetical protein